MADKLFEEWRAYQKLLEHDYMGHRAFFSRLQEEVQNRFNRPLTVLDLGCGDTQPIQSLLRAIELNRYVGVDTSSTALTKARIALAGVDVDAELIEGDFTGLIAEIDGPFDLIVASFSVHHLAGEQAKRSLIHSCRALLADDGLLALIDVFRDDDESRAEYIERWIRFADRHYKALTAEEKTRLFEHVRTCDFPESLSTFRRIGQAENLRGFDILLADSAELNHLVVMSPT